MSEIVDVAIIGAGPYGLSLAAHLRAAGVDYRHFGVPMRLWRGAMPKGMYLKSQGFASNLSDPKGTHTLEAFCQATGHPYASYGLPVSLDNFVNYGQWFQSELDLKVEEVLVTGMVRRAGGFELTLANDEQFVARRVVVAIGVEHFAYVPEPLSELPASACTHSSAHTDLAAFRGQEVVVVGAGQSALESAALLHENGATVQVVARRHVIGWNGEPLDPDRPLLSGSGSPRPVSARAGPPGSTPTIRSCSGACREKTRVYRARTALGPAGASWLRQRVEGQFPVRTGQTVISAQGARRQGAAAGTPALDQPGGGCRPRDRRHRLPHRPEAAGVPPRRGPVRAADRGGQPCGRRRLPVVRPRALLHRGRRWRPPWGRSCGSSSAPSTPRRTVGRASWPAAPVARLTGDGCGPVMAARLRAGPDAAARPGRRARARLGGPAAGGLRRTGSVGPGTADARAAARCVALPAADAAALVTAAVVSGMDRGTERTPALRALRARRARRSSRPGASTGCGSACAFPTRPAAS